MNALSIDMCAYLPEARAALFSNVTSEKIGPTPWLALARWGNATFRDDADPVGTHGGTKARWARPMGTAAWPSRRPGKASRSAGRAGLGNPIAAQEKDPDDGHDGQYDSN